MIAREAANAAATRHAAGAGNFLTDILGSTIGLADSSGTLQMQYGYNPFGNAIVTGASNANPYQFTGRETDSTGLYFYRARYYHGTFQRFISQDPIEYAGGGANPYNYVDNDPINFSDLLGFQATPTPGPEPSPIPNPIPPSPTPNPEPSPTPSPGPPTATPTPRFGFWFCVCAANIADPAPVVGCGSGLSACLLQQSCDQAQVYCPILGAIIAGCYGATSGSAGH
jgi:RHS repeat-associated protein